MSRELVLFKHSPDRLLIVLETAAEVTELMLCIEEKIAKNHQFFKGASLRLKYIGKDLTQIQEKQVTELFERIGEVEVLDIGPEITLPPSPAGTPFRGIAYGLFENGGRKPVKNAQEIQQIAEGLTMYYRGNLCKGQRIVYKGSVVIIGNVRAGAEVVASENIIVFGTIQGTVQAGGKNLKTAVIMCEALKSKEISLCGISKKEEGFGAKLKKKRKFWFFGRNRVQMKILSLHNNRIVVDTLSYL